MSRLGALLPSLYSTAQDVSRWAQVLDGICDVVGTRNAAMQILQREGDYLRPVMTARDSYSLAHATLHDHYVNNDANPRLNLRYAARAPKNIVRDSDRFAAASPEFADLRARLAAIGLGSSICVTFELRPDRYFSLIMHRSVDDLRDFDACDEAALDELLPHLRQTMELSASLDDARSGVGALRNTVEMLRLGVVLCDAAGQVDWLNRSAQAMIDRSTLLGIRNGRLGSASQGAAKTLRRILAADPNDDGWPVMAIEQDGDMLQLRAAPLAPGSTGRALFLSDAAAPLEIAPDDVARLFSLSPAEARLAAAIAGGASVSSYSEMRGISVGTARIQMKQVLAKTQAGKQADLTRRLCGSVAAQTVKPH